MSFNVCKSHRITFKCSGDGWIMCEGMRILWFPSPMLGWGGLSCFWHVLEHVLAFGTKAFVVTLLSIIKWSLVYATNSGNCFWSFEGNTLVFLLIWFEPLRSFTSNSSFFMWHIQHGAFNWCTCMLFFGWWPHLTSSHILCPRNFNKPL